MRAIFWKEAAEFRPALLIVALAGAALGFVPKGESSVVFPLVLVHASLGAAMGAWHAWLDRRAAEDAFLQHRPVARWRIDTARSVAGLAAVLFGSAVSLAVTLFVPVSRGYETLGAPWEPQPWPMWIDWSPGAGAFAVAFGAAAWTLVRVGAGSRNGFLAVLGGAGLPALLLLAAGATRTDGAAIALVLGALVAGGIHVVLRSSVVRRSTR